MHTIHHTEAVILKSQPAGEANRRVWLFTEQFGLVVAMVQGVRKQGAKLQMNVIDYAFISADLVKGKDVWRLVNAIPTRISLEGILESDLARGYVRTLGAVERFCQGEEPHEALYAHLRDCGQCVQENDADPRSFDTLSVWKVMMLLGYMAFDAETEELFTLPFAQACEKLTGTLRNRLITETNTAIRTTHL